MEHFTPPYVSQFLFINMSVYGNVKALEFFYFPYENKVIHSEA